MDCVVMYQNDRFRPISASEHEQKRRELYALGYTTIPNLVTRKTIEALHRLISDIQAGNFPESSKDRNDTGLVFNLQIYDPLFIELLCEPTVRSLLVAELNDPYYTALPADAPNYILAYYNARQSQAERLRLHIDSVIPVTGPRTWSCQVMFCLDEQRRANGCTFVVPGSHRSGEYTDRDLEHTSDIESEPGDVVIWDSRLWHGAHMNTSGASRWALIATFHAWWVKQKMDIPRTLPQRIYERLSVEQKQLMGFCSIVPRRAVDDSATAKRGYDALLRTVDDYWL